MSVFQLQPSGFKASDTLGLSQRGSRGQGRVRRNTVCRCSPVTPDPMAGAGGPHLSSQAQCVVPGGSSRARAIKDGDSGLGGGKEGKGGRVRRMRSIVATAASQCCRHLMGARKAGGVFSAKAQTPDTARAVEAGGVFSAKALTPDTARAVGSLEGSGRESACRLQRGLRTWAVTLKEAGSGWFQCQCAVTI